MRNLKKLLALVLAMVMTFSLMLSASAVDFDDYTDKDSITDEFTESVAVLTGLAVMQGDEKGFRPSDKITRAEAAAVIYRAVTGDVTDRQSALYKDYSTFTDVKSDDWFAGYVGYCQNAGYIKGTSPTTFQPYGQVTGYEVLAMILRAVGYGKNNEFVGSSWQVNVAALSKQLGVTRNVVAAHMDQTLNMAAPREVVADLIFMTIATVPTVTYTPALAYNDKQSVLTAAATPFNPTLGQKVFGLFYSTTWELIDEWGRPGYYWWKNGTWPTVGTLTTVNTGLAYVTPIGHPVYSNVNNYTDPSNANYNTPAGIAWREANLVATIAAVPDYETKEQVRECDVAHELGINTEDTFNLFVNGLNGNDLAAFDPDGDWVAATNGNYRIVATDTVTRVGGQGRVSEFYYQMSNPWFQQTTTTNVAVMIDTMLAQVTGKTDAKLDKNNHVIVPAQLEVTIWDGPNAGPNAIATTSSKRILSKANDDADNWDEYSRGDYILLNAWTNKTARLTNDQRDHAAFETDKVIGADNVNNVLIASGGWDWNARNQRAWIVDNGKNGIAESFNGKQTVTYWNQNKHQVDGKDYNDQLCLFMDRAGNNTGTTYTWFLDQYGNLIGIGDASASRFGVITSIYAAISTDDSDTTGRVKAVANVRFTDGETGTVNIDSFLMSSNVAAFAAGAAIETALTPGSTTSAGTPNTVANTQLTASANTVELLPVYDTVAHGPMMAGQRDPQLTSAPGSAANGGWLYLAPSSASNLQAHNFTLTNDTYGVLYDHMFEFTTASDNTVVAVEVAGAYTVAGGYTNTGDYADKANGAAFTDKAVGGGVTADTNAAARGRVYKNLAYMTLNTASDGTAGQNAGVAAATVYLDNNTQILLRGGSTRTTLTAYTLETLPGDITLGSATQADWADIDGDGRADYLYVEGTVPGTVTYNLFYYNGGAAEWNGTTGTAVGYLNGVETTLNFNNYGRFTAVTNSNGYDGHLFALQITNDVVSSVMRTDNVKDGALANIGAAGTRTDRILDQWVAAAANFQSISGEVIGNFGANLTTNNAAGTLFVVGRAGGNTYTANTEAVYWHDSTTVDAARLDNLAYERVSNGYQITVSGAHNETYWISPSASIVGELEWLNQGLECDVTIVYENTASNAAVQVYITPDPDVTPVNPWQGAAVATAPAGGNVMLDTTAAGLTATLLSGVNNTVVYTGTAGVIPNNGGSNIAANLGVTAPIANQVLYFPYSISGAATTRLEIRVAGTNTLVYAESGAVNNNTLDAASGASHCYVINFVNAAGNAVAPGASNNLPLRAGVTYTFQITTTTALGVTNILSSGSFTMA